MEKALADKGFVRCNKGYLVNLAHVEGIQNSCAIVHGESLLISRNRKLAFRTALDNYVRGVS